MMSGIINIVDVKVNGSLDKVKFGIILFTFTSNLGIDVNILYGKVVDLSSTSQM